jgi:tRNA uridine 5-carboxymethylaminomethyl modification enzyme
VDDARWGVFQGRQSRLAGLRAEMAATSRDGQKLTEWARRPEVDVTMLAAALGCGDAADRPLLARLLADIQYAGYVQRQHREVAKLAAQESTRLPTSYDYQRVTGLRREAQQVLQRFQPATLGQASRLAGVTPADMMLLTVAMNR